MRFVLPLALLALVACQSEQEGFALLCESAERCTECRAQTVDDASLAHWRWMDENIENDAAHDFADGVAHGATSFAGQLLRDTAREAGVHRCPLADHLEDIPGMHRMWGSTDLDTRFEPEP